MAQCSEQILSTRNANDLYQNGVEMQLARRSAQCPETASITYVILGKHREYCTAHGEQRRAWAAEMAQVGKDA